MDHYCALGLDPEIKFGQEALHRSDRRPHETFYEATLQRAQKWQILRTCSANARTAMHHRRPVSRGLGVLLRHREDGIPQHSRPPRQQHTACLPADAPSIPAPTGTCYTLTVLFPQRPRPHQQMCQAPQRAGAARDAVVRPRVVVVVADGAAGAAGARRQAQAVHRDVLVQPPRSLQLDREVACQRKGGVNGSPERTRSRQGFGSRRQGCCRPTALSLASHSG